MILIAFVILILLAVLAVVYGYYKHSKIFYGIAGALVVIGFVINSFTIIPTNYTGVRTTFKQIDENTLKDGFHWKIPFVQSIETINNKLTDIKFTDKISAETSKRTEIYYNDITITYHIAPSKSAWIFANVTDYEDNLISSDIVGSAIKSTSKTLNDIDATNRAVLEPVVTKYIQKSLNNKYGDGVVIINKVVVLSANFSKSYNKAVADKQKAQLESEKQSIQNEKNIAKAEADAKVKRTEAQANADAKLIAAKAEKQANEMKEKSITNKILQEEYINKWNGVMPKFVSGTDSNMLFNIPTK